MVETLSSNKKDRFSKVFLPFEDRIDLLSNKTMLQTEGVCFGKLKKFPFL